jgi:hypothetical protein
VDECFSTQGLSQKAAREACARRPQPSQRMMRLHQAPYSESSRRRWSTTGASCTSPDDFKKVPGVPVKKIDDHRDRLVYF